MTKLTVRKREMVKSNKSWWEIKLDEAETWLKNKVEVMQAIASTLQEHEFQAMRYEARMYEIAATAIAENIVLADENKQLKAQLAGKTEGFIADRLTEIAEQIRAGRFVGMNHDCY